MQYRPHRLDFEKHVYFEGSRCPTHDEVVQRLTLLAADEHRMSEDPTIPGPHTFEIKQCLEAIRCIECAERLPCLAGNLIGANTFCSHPRWGRQPISVARIDPEKFEEPFKSWYER